MGVKPCRSPDRESLIKDTANVGQITAQDELLQFAVPVIQTSHAEQIGTCPTLLGEGA